MMTSANKVMYQVNNVCFCKVIALQKGSFTTWHIFTFGFVIHMTVLKGFLYHASTTSVSISTYVNFKACGFQHILYSVRGGWAFKYDVTTGVGSDWRSSQNGHFGHNGHNLLIRMHTFLLLSFRGKSSRIFMISQEGNIQVSFHKCSWADKKRVLNNFLRISRNIQQGVPKITFFEISFFFYAQISKKVARKNHFNPHPYPASCFTTEIDGKYKENP